MMIFDGVDTGTEHPCKLTGILPPTERVENSEDQMPAWTLVLVESVHSSKPSFEGFGNAAW